MEFEELKKIWDTQNNQPMYAINEEALHNRILTKKRKTNKISSKIRMRSCLKVLIGKWWLLATKEPEQQSQHQADDDRGHQREIETTAFPLNDDIARQPPQTQLAQPRPQ